MIPTTSTTTTCSTTPTTSVTDADALTVGRTSISCINLSLEGRCYSYTNGLLTEIVQIISMQCLSNSDFRGFLALGSTNVHCCISTQKFLNERSLIQLCPGLRIFDAKAHKFTDGKELCINKLKTVRCFFELTPFVEGEGNEKLMIVFNKGGLTLNQVVAEAKKRGITVDILWDRISEKLGDVPEEDLGPEMISIAPVKATRNKSFEIQKDRVREVGFHDMPTLIGYLLVCISIQEISEKQICPYGQKPLTYGRSSTHVGGNPLAVGDSAPGRLNVGYCSFDNEDRGAGGQRKF